MSATNTPNGRPQRKQLSDQLDRFDALLDGLAEGLNDSIADAVRDGTRLALKDAIVEILTDPKLRERLKDAVAPETARQSHSSKFAGWVKGLVNNARRVATRAANVVFGTAKNAGTVAVEAIQKPIRVVRLLAPMKDLMLVGVAGGLAVAAISFAAPHTVSAVLSGITGAAAAILLRAGNWARRAIRTVVA